MRSSGAANHYGFLFSSETPLTYISSEKAIEICTRHIHCRKGSSSAQTTNPSESGDSQASQVSYPNLWPASCKHTHSPGSCACRSHCQRCPWNAILWCSATEPHTYALHLLLLGICWWLVNRTFFSHCTRSYLGTFLSLFITIIFLLFLETPGFDHCQGLINEKDGISMSSENAIFITSFQWCHLLVSYFKGLFQ